MLQDPGPHSGCTEGFPILAGEGSSGTEVGMLGWSVGKEHLSEAIVQPLYSPPPTTASSLYASVLSIQDTPVLNMDSRNLSVPHFPIPH